MSSAYENLPVYKKALDLTVYFENIVRHFDKYHKYTVGSELRKLSMRIVVLTAKANLKANRIEMLVASLEKLEELKILIHVCKEIKAFNNPKSFEVVCRLVLDITKQCEGWLSKSQNPSPLTGGGARK